MDTLRTPISSDELIGKLLSIDNRRNDSRNTEQTRTKNSTPIDTGTFQYKCYKCHRYRHRISECPEKDSVKSQNNTKKRSSFITIAKNQALPEKWHVDSESSNHVTPNKNSMSKFSTNAPQSDITIANNEVIKSQGVGNVPIVLKGSGTVSEITNVLYVPDATVNILSATLQREHIACFSQKTDVKYFTRKDVRS
jgi:hypothetical protein